MRWTAALLLAALGSSVAGCWPSRIKVYSNGCWAGTVNGAVVEGCGDRSYELGSDACYTFQMAPPHAWGQYLRVEFKRGHGDGASTTNQNAAISGCAD